MALYELVYVSEATRDFTPDALAELLRYARKANARSAVTGILIHHRGRFTQLLEGERDEVERLYHQIERDPRHRASRIVWQSAIDARSFGQWSMGWLAPDDDAIRREPGYSLFLESGALKSAANPAAAGRHFLLTLRQQLIGAS